MASPGSDGKKTYHVLRHSGLWCALAAMVVAVETDQVRAQCVGHQKLTASDADHLDNFGYAVSVYGDSAVVGAWLDDCAAGEDCGSAYVFRRSGTTWVQEQKLIASDAGVGNAFGFFVSVAQDMVVIGAPGAGPAGAAYVYRFDGSTWLEVQKLTTSDVGALNFGYSVSVSGNKLVMGAHHTNCTNGFACGAAYVFQFDGVDWVEQQKLTASDAAPSDLFGFSVSVSGDRVVVGAKTKDCAAGIFCGAAYVFRYNGASWVEEQKLTASDAGGGQHFGESVSMGTDAFVVGAVFANCEADAACGAAYVFRFDGTSWAEEQKLTASDGIAFDGFGGSVSMGGDTVLVGARTTACSAGRSCGSAYVYRLDGISWVEQLKLTARDAVTSDFFGKSVSMSGETAVVGAEGGFCAAGFFCGSAHVFDLDHPCPGCGNENLDPGEECDGMSDATCPGACLNDCTCGPFCGDSICDPDESVCSCSADCGSPSAGELLESTCSDGLDNDCDGFIDSDDSDCIVPPIPTISAWSMVAMTLLLLVTGKCQKPAILCTVVRGARVNTRIANATSTRFAGGSSARRIGTED